MQGLLPYTKVQVLVQTQTPWAKSRQPLKTMLHLPMGKPSKPENFQVFYEPAQFQPFWNENQTLQYYIKWAKPKTPNGPISNYALSIQCHISTPNSQLDHPNRVRYLKREHMKKLNLLICKFDAVLKVK